MHSRQAKIKMHLCIAGSIRAMPEKVKPPAKLADIYSSENYFIEIGIFTTDFPHIRKKHKHF